MLCLGGGVFVWQGVQRLGSKAIIYSGGSFIDDYAVDEEFRNDLSCLWLATYGPCTSSSSNSRATDDKHKHQQQAIEECRYPQLEAIGNIKVVRGHVPAESGGCSAAGPAAPQPGVVAGAAAAKRNVAPAPAGVLEEVAAEAALVESGRSTASAVPAASCSCSVWWAVPISIQHHWTDEEGQELGLPPYLPEVLAGAVLLRHHGLLALSFFGCEPVGPVRESGCR